MKKREFDLEWLTSSQSNENGYSRGNFDYQKDKWTAFVHVNKTNKNYEFKSRSHRKVAIWLRNMQRKYNLG